MAFSIGKETVGIVKQVPVLDAAGDPIVNEFFEKQTTEEVIWKNGCAFEIQLPALNSNQFERETPTGAVTRHVAWATLPPDDDTKALKSVDVLRHNGIDYQMRGDAVTEVDMRGRANHVFCLCEVQG